MRTFEDVVLNIHVDQLIVLLEQYDELEKDSFYSHSSYAARLAAQVDSFLNYMVKDEQQKARLQARAAARAIDKTMRTQKPI